MSHVAVFITSFFVSSASAVVGRFTCEAAERKTALICFFFCLVSGNLTYGRGE